MNQEQRNNGRIAMSRQIILAACLFLNAVFLTPAAAQGKAPSLNLATVPWINAPIFTADKLGYWRDEGLDVKLTILPSTPKQIELIVAGELVAGTAGYIPFIIAVSRGVKIVAVADASIATKENPLDAIIVRKDSPIKTLADLKGKTIAVHSKGGVEDVVLRGKVFPALKLDPDRDVKIVEIPWPQMEGALKAGTVDAVHPIEPFLTRIADNNRILPRLEEYSPPEGEPIAFIVMSQVFVKKNPELVRKFLRGYLRGVTTSQTMKIEELAKIEAEYLKLPAELIARIRPVQFAADGRILVKSVQRQADELHKMGFIQKKVTVADHIDHSYLPPKR